ncbi:BTB domain-containing protein [Aphelenchoides bicaudatus]|nr:BTB domain-containing protein [Aphelenchoides bicaudatus]
MANFLRKFVEKSRSKSRSKSPVKRPNKQQSNHVYNDFEPWVHPGDRQSYPQQRMPPMIRTQYVDENAERFQPQPFSNYSSNTWHRGTTDPFGNTTLTANGWPPSHRSSLQPPFESHANTSSTEYMNMTNLDTLHSRDMNGFPRSSTSRLALLDNGANIFNSNNDLPDQIDFGSRLTLPSHRLRSESPQKSPKEIGEHRSRSKSPKKKPSTVSGQTQPIHRTLDYTHSQCKLEGCSAAIIVDDSRFLVCKHQLAHISEFFRNLFLNNRALPQNGVKQLAVNEYTIIVSSLKYPPQHVQFQWFLECSVPNPMLREITDEVLETCMRLSKRFVAKGLEARCARFIKEHVERKNPMTALCWLNWVLKHRFDRSVQDACACSAARLPLIALEKHRQMITEKLLADILAMKLRVVYGQAANAFHTIHKMDHFHVDIERCPRCGRQKEQGRIRLLANPCQKMIGCDRCLKDLGCEIEKRGDTEFQAFYQCDHGLIPFGEETEDCTCQSKFYKRRSEPVNGSLFPSVQAADSQPTTEFDGEPV